MLGLELGADDYITKPFDLDILVPEATVLQFKGIMTKIGYRSMGVRNSPEDEELLKFESHLDPLSKEEGIMVEAHLNILGLKGDRSVVNPEVWQEKEGTKSDGMEFSHLSKEHFIIYGMVHYSKHLSNEGFSVVAPISVMRPLSTCGRKASC
jgi:CheY-like chemotaxis protein